MKERRASWVLKQLELVPFLFQGQIVGFALTVLSPLGSYVV